MSDFKHVEEQIDAVRDLEQHGCIEGSCMYTLAGIPNTMRALLDVAKRAKIHSDAIDQGFVSEVRPDIARAELNRALAKLREQNDD